LDVKVEWLRSRGGGVAAPHRELDAAVTPITAHPL
jgi:hypothetical protein